MKWVLSVREAVCALISGAQHALLHIVIVMIMHELHKITGMFPMKSRVLPLYQTHSRTVRVGVDAYV